MSRHWKIHSLKPKGNLLMVNVSLQGEKYMGAKNGEICTQKENLGKTDEVSMQIENLKKN